jgi:hypothetical protein
MGNGKGGELHLIFEVRVLAFFHQGLPLDFFEFIELALSVHYTGVRC